MFPSIPDFVPPSFPDAVATEDHKREIARLVDRAEKDPRTHTFARLADLYRKGGDLEQALEVVTEGLRHHPHYLNAQLVRAKVLKELGRTEEARTAFERVLDIDSENLVAHAALEELAPGLRPEPRRGPGKGAAATSSPWLASLDAAWREGNGTPREEPVAGDASADQRQEAEPASGVAKKDEAAGAPPVSPRTTTAKSEPAPTPVRSKGADDDNGHELETATLASLYVRQGLFDRAIGVYERLLARDPYNARLASALNDARAKSQDRSTGGPSKPAATPSAPDPAAAAPKAAGGAGAAQPPEPTRAESGPLAAPEATTDVVSAAATTDAAPADATTDVVPGDARTDVVPGEAPSINEPWPGAESPVMVEETIRAELRRLLDGEGPEDTYGLLGGWQEWLARLEQRRG